MKQALLNNIKNIYGWKTKRKIVVISVDDYGNVRLNSKKARKNMDKAGLKVLSRKPKKLLSYLSVIVKKRMT